MLLRGDPRFWYVYRYPSSHVLYCLVVLIVEMRPIRGMPYVISGVPYVVCLTIPLGLCLHCDLRYADVHETGACVRWRQCASRRLGVCVNLDGQLGLAALTRAR